MSLAFGRAKETEELFVANYGILRQYNYVLAAALDTGLAISGIVIFFASKLLYRQPCFFLAPLMEVSICGRQMDSWRHGDSQRAPGLGFLIISSSCSCKDV